MSYCVFGDQELLAMTQKDAHSPRVDYVVVVDVIIDILGALKHQVTISRV